MEIQQTILNYLELNPELDCNELIKIFGLTFSRLAEIFPELEVIETGQNLSLYGSEDEILIYSECSNNNTWSQYYYDFLSKSGFRMDNYRDFHKLLFNENLSINCEVDYSMRCEELEFYLVNPILNLYKA